MVNIVQPVDPHPLLIFLLECGLLLGLALFLGKLGNRIGLPSLVGELLAGVIMGPSTFAHVLPRFDHWLFPASTAQLNMLDAVGQLGMLLLVGITGANIDLPLIKRCGSMACSISIGAFIIPMTLGIATGHIIPDALVPPRADRSTFALFLGIAMGVSAIPVAAKILIELRLLHHKIGQLTLCSVMGNDVAGWMLLSVVSAMATTGTQTTTILPAFGYLALTIVIAVMLRPVVRKLLSRPGGRPDGGASLPLLVSLILLSAAATQAMKLEAVFGAFVCGLVISGCVDSRRVAPLRATVLSFLAPVYFAIAGLG